MAKRPKKKALNTAERYAELLLYIVSGGNLGTKPEKEIVNSTATFGEMRGLLDSLIKIATLEKESEADDEGPSGLDILRKNIAKEKKRDSGEAWDSGDTESATDDGARDIPPFLRSEETT